MAPFHPGTRLFERVPVKDVRAKIFAIGISEIQVRIIQQKADPLDGFHRFTGRPSDFAIELPLCHKMAFRERETKKPFCL